LQAKAAEKEAAKAAKRATQKEKRLEKAAAKAEKIGGGDDTSDQENGQQQNGASTLHHSLSQVSIRSKVSESAAEDDHGRSTTGVLASHPQSRDIQIDSFTLLYHGHDLLQDTRLELNYGRRYGLLGLNGCGKSTMLKALAAREVPIPEHIDMYLLDREMPASDKTALQVGPCDLGHVIAQINLESLGLGAVYLRFEVAAVVPGNEGLS
jgi:ATP-binding cassette subfamily F protein 2